jgi:hypothetical protein
MAVLRFEVRRPLDASASACDTNTHILLLVLLLLLLFVFATSLPLRRPIIHHVIPVLVLAVVQNEHLFVKLDVVEVLLRDHVVLVDNFRQGRLLLLPELLGLKHFRFLTLKLAPLLAQLLNVFVQLVDALRDHGTLLFEVLELAGVKQALVAEYGECGLDFVLALVLLDLELVLAPDAASGRVVVRRR